jgi:putative two-component system response regulator
VTPPGPEALARADTPLLRFAPDTRLEQAGELVSAIQRLSLARTLADVQAIVRVAARRLTGADGATFVLREGAQCFYADEDAISPLWKGQRFPLHQCVSGWVMTHREPVVIDDIFADPRVPADAYRPTFVKSLAMVPIRTVDPVGAIGNYWASHRRPGQHEVYLLQALADSTAVALENIRVYEALEEARLETLQRLALAAEYRDDATYAHTERVARLAQRIAEELGLPASQVSLIHQAAPLHDIGKVAIPDAILLKTGRLTEEEHLVMRRHAVAGAAILSGSNSVVLRLAQEIALTHHEWWDGSGYPSGLSGTDIPLSGRIVALADVVDALLHERPYKRAWRFDAATSEIHRLSGRQFDPAVVAAFDKVDFADLELPADLEEPSADGSDTQPVGVRRTP